MWTPCDNPDAWDCWKSVNGNVSIIDNELQFTSVPVLFNQWNGTHELWLVSNIRHKSPINNGSWSFDVYPGEKIIAMSNIVENQRLHYKKAWV
ncbi:MAG: hypothetical protein ACW981_18750 [Candidatus Hodarchaeales archaeon]|jgi:hypothetical protein